MRNVKIDPEAFKLQVYSCGFCRYLTKEAQAADASAPYSQSTSPVATAMEKSDSDKEDDEGLRGLALLSDASA